MLTPTVTSMGYELWGVEYLSQGKYSVLRIYIDKDAGVTLDELGDVSRQVNAVLDVEEPIHGEYQLEVSSPGIDRRLFFPEQYARYVNSQLQVKLHDAIDNRRNFKGELVKATDEHIVLLCDEQEFELELTNIEKANVLSEMNHGK